MDVAPFFVTLALLIPAELPDKTFVATLVLSTRFPPLWVWLGVSAAFAVQTTIAVVAGQLLTLLPHTPVQLVTAALFALGAVLMFRGARAVDAAEGATHEENRAEGDKDMRSTEASYVARGHAERTVQLEQALVQRGHHSYLLDGDNIRHGLNKDLDFSDAGREENIRRIGEVSALFVDAGLIVITAFISPFRADRDQIRKRIGDAQFIEVYVSTSLEECEKRDPKGLYGKARAGQIRHFTGIDSPYEPPLAPQLTLDTSRVSLNESVDRLLRYLEDKGFLHQADPGL